MVKGRGAGRDFQAGSLLPLLVHLAFDAPTGQRLRKLKEYNAISSAEDELQWEGMDVLMECEPDKNFRIIVKDLQKSTRQPDHAVCVSLHIDGRHVEDRILFGTYKDWITTSINVRRDGGIRQCPIRFAAIETVEDPRQADVKYVAAKSLGSVYIRLEYGRMASEKRTEYPPCVVEEVGKVYEEDAKMGTITTGGEEPVEAPPTRGDAYVFRAADERYFYEFRIRYATKPVIEKLLDRGTEAPNQPFVPDTPQSRSSTTPSTTSTKRTLTGNPPPLALRSKKRFRPSSSRSRSSSSEYSTSAVLLESGSSSSDDADLAEMFSMFRKRRRAKKQKERELRVAQQVEKEAERQRKREERAKERRGLEAQYAIDLTGDTDVEEGEEIARSSGEKKSTGRRMKVE